MKCSQVSLAVVLAHFTSLLLNNLIICFVFRHRNLQSEARATHLLYSGRTDVWSLTSRSFTWVTMANFQLSSTWVRLEQVFPLGDSSEDRHLYYQHVSTLKSTDISAFKMIVGNRIIPDLLCPNVMAPVSISELHMLS